MFNIDDLLKLCPTVPRDDLCSDINPELWSAWCRAANRPDYPSFVWRESDVVEVIKVGKEIGDG